MESTKKRWKDQYLSCPWFWRGIEAWINPRRKIFIWPSFWCSQNSKHWGEKIKTTLPCKSLIQRRASVYILLFFSFICIPLSSPRINFMFTQTDKNSSSVSPQTCLHIQITYGAWPNHHAACVSLSSPSPILLLWFN